MIKRNEYCTLFTGWSRTGSDSVPGQDQDKIGDPFTHVYDSIIIQNLI